MNNLPLVQGSGSTAAAAVWRSIIANASATGNAPMSLTYDAVGSGQVRLARHSRSVANFTVCWGLKAFKRRAFSGPHGLQGQKNLFNRAYDYAVSDVPIPRSTYADLDRKTVQMPFAISALDAVYSIPGRQACQPLQCGVRD